MTNRFVLPAAEDDLWQMVVVQLLKQRDVTEAAAELHLRVLEALAFEQQFQGRPITRSRFVEAATRLAKKLDLGGPGDKARQWLADLESWELLVGGSGSGEPAYDFPIPGLGEFFAARYLAARWARPNERRGWRPLRWLALSCRARFPPFRAIIRRPEHEQALLLMIGLVKDATGESALLHAIPEVNRRFKALARSRHIHTSVARRLVFVCRVLLPIELIVLRRIGFEQTPRFLSYVCPQAGLHALRTARVFDNVSPLIENIKHVLRTRARQRLAVVELAIEWAFEIGDTEVAQDLIDLSDKRVESDVLGALMGIGRDAVEPILNAIRGTPDLWPEDIRFALNYMSDPRAVEVLVAALKDESPHVREAAACALGVMESRRAVEPLIATLNDSSEAVCRTTATALGEIGDPRAVRPLVGVLSSTLPDRPAAAGPAFPGLGDPRAIESVTVYSECDDCEQLSYAAAHALASIPQAGERLIDALHDACERVRLTAAAALGWNRDLTAVEPLIGALDDDSEGVRWRAVVALAWIHDAGAVAPVISLLSSPSDTLRDCAAWALGHFGDRRAVEPLLALLRDNIQDVRLQATAALGEIRDLRAVEPLVGALNDEGAVVRAAAALALGNLGEPRAVKPLITSLDDDSPHVRRSCIFALGRIGDSQAIEPLAALARNDDSEEVRAAALRVLNEIQSA